MTSRRELLIIAAFFAIVVIIAFPDTVFFGRSLVPSDAYNPLDFRPLPQNYGPRLIDPHEYSRRGLVPFPNYHDVGGSWWAGEPALLFFRDAILDGELPLWDPFVGAGSPAFANLTNEFLFPPQILLSLAGATAWLKNLYILLIFWTAGFGTAVLLRQHGVGIAGAICAGLVFLFSGAIQQIGPSTFMGQVLACMPVLPVMSRWFLNRPTWRRTALLACGYATVALASFPPLLAAAFGFAAIYVAVSIAMEKTNRGVRWWRFGAAVVLSLGVVAAAYVPAFAALSASPHVRNFYRTAARVVVRPRAALQLLFPTATGGSQIYQQPVMDDHGPHLFYVGTAALLLAGIALGRTRGSVAPLLVASVITGALTALKLFGIPPVQWIASIPGLQTIHFAYYFGVLLDFNAAILAGIGLDRLIRREAEWTSVAISIVALAAGLGALWFVATAEHVSGKPNAWRWIADFRLAVLFASLACALVCAARIVRSRKLYQSLGCVLVALVIVEGITNATYPRQSRFDPFRHLPPYVQAMQRLERTGRFLTGSVLTANLSSAVRVEVLDSLYTFGSTRYYDLYRTYTDPWPWAGPLLREPSVLPPEPVLNRANVGYVAVRRGMDPPRQINAEALKRGYPIAWQDDYAIIYRRITQPRAIFSSSFAVVDPPTALAELGNAPSDRVLIESDPQIRSAPNQPSDPLPQILSASRNRVALRLRAPRAGLLYLADANFPGWTAKVNGRPVKILLANYAFQAVVVPSSDVVVEFRYWPRGLTLGLLVSVVSGTICLILFLRSSSHSDIVHLVSAPRG